eukprot:UN17585
MGGVAAKASKKKKVREKEPEASSIKRPDSISEGLYCLGC